MKKGILILTLLILALFTVSCIYAADAEDAIAISEDTAAIEVAQSDEMTASDDSQIMEQSDDEELILEDNDIDDKPILGEGASTGSFTDLNDLINNQYGSNDTITLSCNYTFNGTDDDDSGFIHGIGINRRVTIDGKGCTIDGSQKARIFNIGYGGSVKFLNINFINGKATGFGWEIHGGAISAEYWNCVVESCNFTNNTAQNQGGALMRITAYNSIFTGNTAYQGGAIHQGSAYNCVFTGNKAIGDYGGAINSGSAYNCTFTGNTAKRDGGAINSGSAYNCTFTGNTANDDGGAICIGSAYNCTFTGNTANDDGGAIAGDFDKPEYFSATLCMFDSNTPDDYRDIRIVNVVLSADNLTTSYKSGDRLLFNLTADNTNYVGFNTTIKIYQDGQEIGTYYALSGEGWIVDLSPGTYNAVLSLDKYEGVTDGTATITITDGTTFWDLNQTINGNTNNTITLDRNYAYNPASDSDFTEGILINRQVTINGNGYTIDAQGKARIFEVLSDNVVLKNIIFKNGNITGDGGAVHFGGSGTVENCNFTNNSADYAGGAIHMYSGSVENCIFINNTARYGGAIRFYNNGTTTNCNFTNNKAIGTNPWGGAICFSNIGNITNCNFADNTATDLGGAVFFYDKGTVTNCNFVDNKATGDYSYGGAINMDSGTVTNCNFTDNTATEDGGAVYFYRTGTVANCNFTGNNATYGGAVYFYYEGNVTNCNFTGNNANRGSAIYFDSTSATKTVSNSCFLNNRANAEALEITKNNNNITITFTGRNNLLNAIYSSNDAEVTFTNVTYWGANGRTNTGSSTITLSGSNKETGQNITVGVVVNDELVLDKVYITDENGTIVLNINAGENYYIGVRHNEDSYYTEAEKIISQNIKFYANVTSISTNNKTVNITAKSNIPNDIIQGKLLFILPNGENITANYAGNGTWWAEHTFDAYGEYKINATYVGLDNVTVNNATITVNKIKTELSGNAITTTYNINKDLIITLKDSNGNPVSGAKLIVDLNGAKTYTTDKNGQVKISTKGLAPNVYTAKVTFNGNTNYDKSTKDIKVTVKKATPKLTAKKKTFKTTPKTKKYTIVLKDNTGKAIKKAKVTLKVKGKTYKATTNSKGKATFKITNLNKKGTFKATVTYKGNKYYNKVSKKAKIKVIVTFKTVSKGSKDKATVKEIQQALKDKGYYLSYKGHYLMVDGKFESCTERSVKEFQHDKGLKVTGKVDEKTARKLGII